MHSNTENSTEICTIKSTEKKPNTTKRMLIMIVLVLLLIATIVVIKVVLVKKMIAQMTPPPPAVVSTAKATYQLWQPVLTAVGTLRAVHGTDLALDTNGLVTEVNIKSGDAVKKDQVLLQLRNAEDVAQLRQLESSAALAQVVFSRVEKELKTAAISRAEYDTVAADLQAKTALVEQQRVISGKKQLRAPFDGYAGIITVNPGTYVNAGTVIVTLQELDLVFVDFHLPQRQLGQLKVGQKVTLTLDAYVGKTFVGAVNAINPKIDDNTRNVQIEASVPNPDHLLLPGMYSSVTIDVGDTKSLLTLPQTAVVFNPYGETVFVVKQPNNQTSETENQAATANSSSALVHPVVQQVFITTGVRRGDQIAIMAGLYEGAEVVSSGQLKLKNGASITIDNSILPANSANPTPQEH